MSDAVGTDRSAQLAELARLVSGHLDRGDPPVAGLRLFTTDVVSEPTSSIADASLALVVQGAKQLVVGDHVLDYGPGDYLVVSVDLPVSGRFVVASPEAPFLGIGMVLDPDVIAAVLVGATGAGPHQPRRGPALGTSAASAELLDAWIRLLRLYDAPGDRAVLAPLVHREIVWRLLTGEQGDLVRQVGTQGSSLAHVGQAVRLIRERFAEPFRVEELAAEVAMSPSTFHRHFRAATTMGPIQFQKKIRLQQARLLLGGSVLDVTGVAAAVGYESPSQFSREYRREWGISPSQALRPPRSA